MKYVNYVIGKMTDKATQMQMKFLVVQMGIILLQKLEEILKKISLCIENLLKMIMKWKQKNL